MPSKHDAEFVRSIPEVVQLRILMEQDFGDLEGKKWSEMQTEMQNKPDFVAVETKEALRRRADVFLDEHLLSLLDARGDGSDCIVAIVSHGIFLSTLWKRLLRRLPARSISLSPNLQSAARPSLEHLGGWSNTGYLELLMTRPEARTAAVPAVAATSPTPKPDVSQSGGQKLDDTIGTVDVPQNATSKATGGISALTDVAADAVISIDTTPTATAPLSSITPPSTEPRIAHGWTTTILTINGKDHLRSLKRTGGGVGSSRYDASQKGIETFFKRRKVE